MSVPVTIGLTPPPANVVAIAQRLLHVAMALEEDANNCAGNPTPELFDDMLRSMLAAKEALVQAFAEIAVGNDV